MARRTEFFALTCALTALAGAFVGQKQAETSVQLVAVQQSFEFVIAAFLGGVNHLFGGLFGAVLLRAKDLSSSGTGVAQWLGDHSFVVLGLMGLIIPPLLTNARVRQFFHSLFHRGARSDAARASASDSNHPSTGSAGSASGAPSASAEADGATKSSEGSDDAQMDAELTSVAEAHKVAARVKAKAAPPPEDAPILLEASDIGLRFGGLAALNGVSVTLRAGEVVGLIGPNGSGKSSFINVMAGIYHHQQGHLTLKGENIDKAGPAFRSRKGIARTYQNVRSWPGLTPREHIMVAAGAKSPVNLPASLLTLPPSVTTTKSLSERAQELADSVGLDRIDGSIDNYSMPSLRRLEIARALAVEPSVLLLDEPAAGMHPDDLPQLVELVGRLRSKDRAIVLVEHHMDVIEATVDRIIVLDQGQLLAQGDMETIRNDQAVREAYLG
jgi:branched-chain amino acid transport system ATP-binding protein